MSGAGEAPLLGPIVPPDPLDLRNSVTAIVHWADSSVLRQRVMREVAFPVDDLQMFLVVNQLVYRGALRPTDLAMTLGMTRTNISKIARRLEDADLARRIPTPGDERSVLVALTPAGREVGDRIAAVAARTQAEALAGWDPEEVAVLQRVLARFARQAIHELAQLSVTHVRRDSAA
jgi:DNA-binding MarR family transcriptional regulator